MADCERGLGRLDRALELVTGPEAQAADRATQLELRIVESGIRRDQGLPGAAVVALQIPELTDGRQRRGSARLYYAYADALLDAGRDDEAREWFARAAGADTLGETDADERFDELDQFAIEDLQAGEEDEDEAFDLGNHAGDLDDDTVGEDQDGEHGDEDEAFDLGNYAGDLDEDTDDEDTDDEGLGGEALGGEDSDEDEAFDLENYAGDLDDDADDDDSDDEDADGDDPDGEDSDARPGTAGTAGDEPSPFEIHYLPPGDPSVDDDNPATAGDPGPDSSATGTADGADGSQTGA
jgi:hypothetical protein